MDIIEDYKIVSEKNERALESSINELIKNGYIPCGTLTVVRTDTGFINMYQPMIKYLNNGTKKEVIQG